MKCQTTKSPTQYIYRSSHPLHRSPQSDTSMTAGPKRFAPQEYFSKKKNSSKPPRYSEKYHQKTQLKIQIRKLCIKGISTIGSQTHHHDKLNHTKELKLHKGLKHMIKMYVCFGQKPSLWSVYPPLTQLSEKCARSCLTLLMFSRKTEKTTLYFLQT